MITFEENHSKYNAKTKHRMIPRISFAVISVLFLFVLTGCNGNVFSGILEDDEEALIMSILLSSQSNQETGSISSVSIRSSNANPLFAKTGDVITLSITSNSSILAPTVTISGNAVTTTGGPNNWTATYTITDPDTEGAVPFTIDYNDTSDNTGTQITTVTDGSSVTFDKTAPTVTITSKLTNDQTPSLAGTVDDTTATINVNVNGSDYAATNNGDGTWTLADNTISTLPAATYSVTVTATDAASNVGTDGTSNELTIDITDPVVTITSRQTNDQTPVSCRHRGRHGSNCKM